eukprot:jgi/Tetstr1/463999/TSEL_008804.t1
MSSSQRVKDAKQSRGRMHQDVLRDVQALLDAPDAPVAPPDAQGGVISTSTLRLMLAEIDPEASMEDDLAAALQREAAAFLEEAVSAGCEVSRRRGSDLLEPSDVALYVSRKRGVSVGRHTEPFERGWRRPDAAVIRRENARGRSSGRSG